MNENQILNAMIAEDAIVDLSLKYPWINKKVDMMKVNLESKYINKVDVFIINHSLHHCANPYLCLQKIPRPSGGC